MESTEGVGVENPSLGSLEDERYRSCLEIAILFSNTFQQVVLKLSRWLGGVLRELRGLGVQT